jgi:hypothetical protein
MLRPLLSVPTILSRMVYKLSADMVGKWELIPSLTLRPNLMDLAKRMFSGSLI